MGFRVVAGLYDVRGAEAPLQGRILWHSSIEMRVTENTKYAYTRELYYGYSTSRLTKRFLFQGARRRRTGHIRLVGPIQTPRCFERSNETGSKRNGQLLVKLPLWEQKHYQRAPLLRQWSQPSSQC